MKNQEQMALQNFSSDEREVDQRIEELIVVKTVGGGGASGFHDVYTEKASVEAFRKTGKFPDVNAGDWFALSGIVTCLGLQRR